MIIIGTAIVVLILITIYITKTYNTFITLNERVRNEKAQIVTQLESRFDAVSSLIELTKKYEMYEAETLENVIRERTGLTESTSIEKLEESDTAFKQVMDQLIAISESYPDLKASEVYVKTMDSIDKFENHVRHARMIYNDVVTKFNRMVHMFPTNIFALIFKFTEKDYFQGTDSKQDVPSLE